MRRANQVATRSWRPSGACSGPTSPPWLRWCGKRYLTEDTKIVEVAGKRRIVCPKCARKLDKGEAEREKRAPF